VIKRNGSLSFGRIRYEVLTSNRPRVVWLENVYAVEETRQDGPEIEYGLATRGQPTALRCSRRDSRRIFRAEKSRRELPDSITIVGAVGP